MQLHDAIAFIQNEYFQEPEQPAVWADLGCGSGLFTHALSNCLIPGSTIYAVDKKNPLKSGITENGIEIIALQSDFEKDDMNMKKLDGILLANSLHYVKDKLLLIGRLKRYLKGSPRFLIVEYDTDTPIRQWVPYPVSFSALKGLFKKAGFSTCCKLGERPSLFGRNGMYAALLSA